MKEKIFDESTQKGSHDQRPQHRPGLRFALRLQCVYGCGSSYRLNNTSWFQFKKSCPRCHYRVIREPGYFTGASWMINYSITALLAFVLGGYLIVQHPEINALLVASIVSLLMIFCGLVLTPYTMAVWLYLDHRFHPLTSNDFESNREVDSE